MRRMGDNAPAENVDLSMKSQIPVKIDRFWFCSKNKGNIQVKVVMSGYITDANGVHDCVD